VKNKCGCEQLLSAKDTISVWRQKITETHRGRGPKCGRGGVTLQCASNPGRFQCIGLDCGNCNRCPYCRGKRLLSVMDRAFKPIENASDVVLHTRTIEWAAWSSLSRWLCRHHDQGGRLRIRGADEKCFVVAEQEFPGSSPMAPAAVAMLLPDAVGGISSEPHAFRLCGEWAESPAKSAADWTRIAAPSDEAVVLDRAKEHGAKIRQLGGGQRGVGFTFAAITPSAKLDDFVAELAALAKGRFKHCPSRSTTKTVGSSGSTRTMAPPAVPVRCRDTSQEDAALSVAA
jgi:hypothetical protein